MNHHIQPDQVAHKVGLTIYRGNRERIEDQKMLLEMLQANTVLEYNGKRWHNVHPLVADFLKEQDLIGHD